MPRHRKKRRTHASSNSEEEKIPTTMVCRKGKVSSSVADLIMDLRNTLRPYTARRLQESSSTTLKELMEVGKLLGVSHMWIVSHYSMRTMLRIARRPSGPTCTFFVDWYSLASDVRKAQRRPHSVNDAEWKCPPLLVLHGFEGSTPKEKIVTSMFQFMFPSIDVRKVDPLSLKRVLLVHYSKEQDIVEIRHYLIRTSPVGLSTPIRKLLMRKLPRRLNMLSDISELVENDEQAPYSSESEGEGPEENKCLLGTKRAHPPRGLQFYFMRLGLGCHFGYGKLKKNYFRAQCCLKMT
eukprot:jgi/Galph1/5092/GphlegSOOS_G3689.1